VDNLKVVINDDQRRGCRNGEDKRQMREVNVF